MREVFPKAGKTSRKTSRSVLSRQFCFKCTYSITTTIYNVLGFRKASVNCDCLKVASWLKFIVCSTLLGWHSQSELVLIWLEKLQKYHRECVKDGQRLFVEDRFWKKVLYSVFAQSNRCTGNCMPCSQRIVRGNWIIWPFQITAFWYVSV